VHELSLAEGTLELALRHARRAGARRVVALHLVAGEFTPLDPTSLEFYWDFVARGTPAEGARLRVRRIPARLTCLDCGADAGDDWRCAACGGSRLRLAAGDECYLEAIDVEGEAA